ncbi:phosphatase and tensin-like protein isoform X2 [Choristoneura fumiferana]|uniref:phosphatase and tensin-like protein isoform X2 n=1 Tax=Choristoneura fumiferana TaxID=7141 RepID=UPI003D15C35C
MHNPIKNMVSKRRKRYIQDGFNLDLAYITERVIAMGFPAEKLEGVYRNHIDEVYRFLEKKHKDHYRIYNLCSERSYDSSKFHERVVRYAFDDHTPPNMELILPFCEDVHSWLNADPRNVAAVHCKAGKGRTGTMICCYLLYSQQKTTADEALQFYGTKRTHDEKGVTIPSQRRYVEYFAALVRSRLQYTATKVHIRELIMSPPPTVNGGQCSLELTVSQAAPPLKAPAGCHEVRRGGGAVSVALTHCTPLWGDVRVDVATKTKMYMRKEKLFHFWFNTFFLAAGADAEPVPAPPDSSNLETFKLTLNKWQLDDAHKDKQHKLCSADFKVELIVQKLPSSSKFTGAGRAATPPSSSASSGSEADTEPDSHWDSGARVERVGRYRPLSPDTERAQNT